MSTAEQGPSRRVPIVSLAAFGTIVALLAIEANRVGRLVDEKGLAGGLYSAHAAAPLITAIGALLVVVLGLALLAPPRARPWLVLATLAPPAAVVLGTATLGTRALDMASALLLFSACWVTGERLLRRLGLPNVAAIFPAAFTVGGGVLGLLILALGKLHLLYWWSVALPVFVVGAIGLAILWRAAWERRDDVVAEITRGPLELTAFAVLAAAFCWVAVYTAAPEVTYDPLYAKAWLPQHWASIHRIDPLFRHPVMGNAGFAQVLVIPGHLVDAHGIGRYLQLVTWLALAGTIWHFGRARGAAGPLAAVCAVVIPSALWQTTTANDDLVLSFVIVGLGLTVLAHQGAESGARRIGFAIGLLAGAALMFKLHLLPLASALALGWIVAGGREVIVGRLAGVLAGGITLAAPPLVQRWVEYGNPVFPMYNNIFRSSHYAPVAESFNLPYWQHPSALDALTTPWTIVWQPDRLNEMAPPGMFGGLLAAMLLLLALGWRRDSAGRRSTLVVWAATIVGIDAWWLSLRYLRYLLPAGFLAVFAVLMFASPPRLGPRGATLAALAAITTLLVALPAFAPISYMVPDHKPPFAVAFGRWDPDDYLRAIFAERDTLLAFDRIAPPGAMAIATVHQRTWLTDGRDLSPMWEIIKALDRKRPIPTGGQRLRARLRELGVEWMIAPGGDPQAAVFLKAGATPVFASNGLVLYRFGHGDRREVSCDPNLRGAPGCWLNGTFDATPGLSAREDADGIDRVLPLCPGVTVEVQAAVAPGGGPATLALAAPSPDRRAGSATVTAMPGSTGRAYLTVPPGGGDLTLHATPGAEGTISTLRVWTHGRCR